MEVLACFRPGFLIGDAATTKEVVLTAFPLYGRVSVFTAMTLMQEKFRFGRIRVFVFVRFSFARLGSAPLGSGRAKNQADIV